MHVVVYEHVSLSYTSSCPPCHHEQVHLYLLALRAHSFLRVLSGCRPGTRKQNAFHIAALNFFLTELFEGGKFSEFIAGELRLKTSETTVLRAQSFNYRVKMCTRLWSLCAHLHAWTSPMVIFLSPRTCWGRGHSLLVKQMRFTNKSMLPPPDIHSTHLSFGWWVTCTEMHCLHLTPVEFIIEILLILL